MEDMLLNVEFMAVLASLESWLKKLSKIRANRIRSNVFNAEDLQYEAIDKLWEKVTTDPTKVSNIAWCKTVMQNAIKDVCKSEMRKKKTENQYKREHNECY